MVEIKLDLKDNSASVKKAKEAKKASKAKKPLKTMKEAWTDIMKSATVSKSAKQKARMKKLYNLMEYGEVVREPEKLNKNFTYAEANRIMTAYEDKIKAEYLESLKTLDEDYYVMVTDPADLVEIKQSIKARKRNYVAVDTETTGTDPYTDKIVGFSVTWAIKDYDTPLAPDDCLRNFYIPIAHENATNMDFDKAMEFIKWLVEVECMETVWFNYPFDYHILESNAGIKVQGSPIDGLPLMRLLNENVGEERREDGTRWSYKLKDLVTRYLKIPSETYGNLFGKKSFATVDVDIARWYASKDTHVTYLLVEWQYAMLNKPNFAGIKKYWEEVERPATQTFMEMESEGFELVEASQVSQSSKARKLIKEMEAELKNYFGDINFGSPAQLVKAFKENGFDKHLGKGAKLSSDKHTLATLAKHEPIIKVLQDHRKLTKQLTSFIDRLPKDVKYDGKIHGTFNQVGTKTIRASAENPNLQQQSNGFEIGDDLFSSRDMLSVPKGSLILSADFGRQEMTWQAEYSRDKTLIDLLNGTKDLYGYIASEVWGQPYEDCIDKTVDGVFTKSKWRKMAKILVLAISYEMSDMGLAPMLGLKDGNVVRWIAIDSKGKNAFTSERKEVVETWVEQGKLINVGEEFKVVEKSLYLTAEQQAMEIIDYLDVLFPDLRKWKNGVKEVAHKQFYVDSRFGARRRFTIPTEGKYGEAGYVKGDYYYDWRNKKVLKAGAERQAINFHIQNSAAYQTKCAQLAISHFFKSIETPERHFSLLAPVHDELLMTVPEDVTTYELEMVQHLMVNSARIIACGRTDLAIGKTWGDMDDVEELYPDYVKFDGKVTSDPNDNEWTRVFEELKQDIDEFITEGKMAWRN